ncbi:MAG TPA: hypothetical protein VEY87_13615 [Gaiellaceae bacterium]|jgi:hypothetical protein|nr:hypothetical protein [Gaiellaceae bacterium]
MSPAAPRSHLAGALAPTKLRKDAIRLGLLAGVTVGYGVLFAQPVLDALLIGLNGFAVLVTVIAIGFAATALRRHGRTAAIALAVYGASTAAHLVAILLLLSH